MRIYYTSIIYGIDLKDKDTKDLDFWSFLFEDHAQIAKAQKIQGTLIRNINESLPFIGYAIAYDPRYRVEQENVGTLEQRTIVNPSLQEFCEVHFPEYCKIANDSWNKLIIYLKENYPDREIPERTYFVIEDYD